MLSETCPILFVGEKLGFPLSRQCFSLCSLSAEYTSNADNLETMSTPSSRRMMRYDAMMLLSSSVVRRRNLDQLHLLWLISCGKCDGLVDETVVNIGLAAFVSLCLCRTVLVLENDVGATCIRDLSSSVSPEL